MTAPGTRRPREGRCERCDRPLCMSDDTHDTGCSSADVCHAGRWACDCDGVEVDWRARALAAEAALADAEAREREACAALADDAAKQWRDVTLRDAGFVADGLARAIRARGGK